MVRRERLVLQQDLVASRRRFVEGELPNKDRKSAEPRASAFPRVDGVTIRRCRFTVRPFISATSSALAPEAVRTFSFAEKRLQRPHLVGLLTHDFGHHLLQVVLRPGPGSGALHVSVHAPVKRVSLGSTSV